jgi:hypothetical protein
LIVTPVDSWFGHDALDSDPKWREQVARFFVLAVLDTDKEIEVEAWEGPEVAKRLVEGAQQAPRRTIDV